MRNLTALLWQRLVTWDHLRASTRPAEDLAKLPAKAEIAEKDVFAQILYLMDCHRQRRDFTTVASGQAPDLSR
jgi:hypothetical protein